MSPPTTRTIDSRAAPSPASSPTSGPSNAPGRRRARRHPAGAERRSPCPGRTDDDDLGRERPHGVDRVVEQRSAIERFGELVAPEAAGPPAGQDRGRRGGGPSSADRRRRPRPGHVAGVGPAQDPAPVEVLEDRHDVLAAGPRRVAEGGRRQRGRRRPAQAPAPRARGTSQRRRRGPARGRRCARSVRAHGSRRADSRGTAAASANAGRGRDRQRTLEPVHRGGEGRVRDPCVAGERLRAAGPRRHRGPGARRSRAGRRWRLRPSRPPARARA